MKKETMIATIEEQIAEDLHNKFPGWEDERVDQFNYVFVMPDGNTLFVDGIIKRGSMEDTLEIFELVSYNEDNNEEINQHISAKKIEKAFNY